MKARLRSIHRAVNWKRVLLVKGTVTVGVLAIIFLPQDAKILAVATNLIWIWVDPK